MRSSSRSPLGKPPRWTPSSVCCWKWRYEALEHAGLPADLCAAHRPEFSSGRASASTGTWRRRIWPSRCVVGHRRRAEHYRQPAVVLSGPAGAVGGGGHGVFVVAGGGASGLSEPADGRVRPRARRRESTCSVAGDHSRFDRDGDVADGPVHAFDAGADGFVRGEGCGVVVLKRLADAVRDGDRVLAVVRGSAVNQDGRSNGLMAPNPAAQMAVLRARLRQAGIAPRHVELCRGPWNRHVAG